MDTVRRPRVVLDLLSNNFPHLLERGQTIYHGLSTHPALFVSPNPPLTTLLDVLQQFAQAQQAVSTRVKDAVPTRNLKAGALVTNLGLAQGYVQSLVDAAPGQADLIVTAAGMFIARSNPYAKPILQARQAMPGAPVVLVANVGLLVAGLSGKVLFNWQYRVDGGNAWLNAPPTPHGQTRITGLTPLTTCDFRVSVTSKAGPDEWSQAVTFLVH